LGIVGERLESGIRIDVERPRGHGPPWRYAGRVATPSGHIGVEVEVDGSGAVTVRLQEATCPAAAPAWLAGLAEKVRLLVRAVVKHSEHAEGERTDPPRRIVRWRGEG
jgi:hypothetical protein